MSKQFTIAELERFTSIKAHTFRIWESRFDFLQSKRTQTGIRYYSLADVKYLLDITLLNKAGYKVSAIDRMNEAEKSKVISNLGDSEMNRLKVIHSLIIAMYAGDIERFEFILDNCISYWQIDSVITDVILPFMERICLFCYTDTRAETHFVVNAIRKKLIVGIEKQTVVGSSNRKALLFLPKNEHYDLMLLYLNFVLRSCGIRTFYLGTNLSFADLLPTLISTQPDYVFTYLHPKQKINGLLCGELAKIEEANIKLYCVVCNQPSASFTAFSNFQFVHYHKIAELVH